MEVIKSVREMQERARIIRKSGRRIGVVPTMGFLHEGHLSLLRIARKKCDVLVMTLFVNPTQFGPTEDLAVYPRDFQRDKNLAEKEKTDIIFAPDNDEMYPFGFKTRVEVPDMGNLLCGKFRPDHFRGVTTIVAKLFHCVMPHVAVFGQKDAQQFAIIKRMASDLFFDIEILLGPIVREPDGLAMSSRNVYLNDAERTDALALSKSLFLAGQIIGEGERSSEVITEEIKIVFDEYPAVTLEYVEIVHPDTLDTLQDIEDTALIAVAARIGKTRLIDNCIISL